MGAEIDRLEVQVEASATRANSALDRLTGKLEVLANSLTKINGSGLTGLANGVQKLGTAMQSMSSVKSADFTKTANGLKKLGEIDSSKLYATSSALNNLSRGIASLGQVNFNTQSLTNLANAVSKFGGKMAVQASANLPRISNNLTAFVRGMNTIGSVNFDMAGLANLISSINKFGGKTATQATANLPKISNDLRTFITGLNGLQAINFDMAGLASLVSSISRLGGKTVTNAVANIPLLATALRNLMATLSTAPTVSRNVIQLVNSLAALAGQGGRVGSASNSIVNGLLNTGSAMSRTRKQTLSLAAAFGKFYANFFLVVRGIKKLWESIESSMDYVETFNYFSVALDKIGKEFGGQFEKYGYDSAEAYANSFSERLEELTTKMTGYSIGDNGELLSSNKIGLGLDPNQLMQFQAQVSSVTNSVGLIGETSTNVSKALSMLSSDMSSLFNVDLSTVMTNLQSGLIGQSRALYKYGIDITNTTLQQYAYQYGVEKSVSAMSQAEKMQLRMLAILDQSKVSWGDQANTINSVANQYRIFKQQIANVGRTIGNLFLPIVQKVLPYVNGMIIAVNRLLTSLGFKIHGGSWLTDIMDGISGGGASDALEGIADETDSMADSLDDASKSAKKLQGVLQKFDELNNITTQDSSSSSGSDSKSGGSEIDLSDAIANAVEGYESVWNEAVADSKNKAEAIANNIIGAFEEGDYEGIGTYISTGIANALQKINWTEVYSNANNFGTGLAQFLNGLITPNLFGTVGKTVAGSLNTAIYTALSFGTTFDFSNLGLSIATGINEFFEEFDFKALAQTLNVWVDGIKTAIWTALTNISWDQVLGGAMDFLGELELDTVSAVIGSFLLFHNGAALTKKLFADLITKAIGSEAVIQFGLKAALVITVATGGFNLGKWIGENLFQDDAEYYQEFSWQDVFGSFTDGSFVGACEETFKESITVAAFYLSELKDKVEEKFEKIAKEIKKKKLEIGATVENIKEKVSKKWSETEKYWSSKKPLEKVKTTYENVKDKVKEKWEATISYWAEKTKLKEVTTTYQNFRDKVKEKWDKVTDYWEGKKVLGEVKTTYENFREKVKEKWDKVTDYWEKERAELSEITAKVVSLKGKLSDAWEEAKKWWDDNKPSLSEITAKIKLPHLKVEWDVDGFAAKALQKLGLKGYPNFSVSYYAQGGFPEDGWFRANHGEIMGKFDNGKSVVANNRQITEGIAIAVNEGNQENNMLMRQEISLLQRQNELLVGILEKETGISSNDIFNSVRKSAKEYSNRTGNPAFDY